MRYVLERKDKSNVYFDYIDFTFEFMTSDINNARVFYSKEDAEIFNVNYLHEKYKIKEIGV